MVTAMCGMDIITIPRTIGTTDIIRIGTTHRFTLDTVTTGQCIFLDRRTSAVTDSAAVGAVVSAVVER